MTRVLMFVGKGGVGKTTLSTATALASSGKRLLISTDQAPSLSDLLTTDVRDEKVEVEKGLWAMELSLSKVLDMWKNEFGEEVYQVARAVADVDRSILDYIGTAPGIDEEFMLYFVMKEARSGNYDLVVWDSAPAGHTFRLLRMPILFVDHLNRAAKLYAKLRKPLTEEGRRSVLSIVESWRFLAEEIFSFLKDIEFVAVTIPERLGVEQLKRIKRDFEKEGLRIKLLIVNFVIEDASCAFLRKRMEVQRKYLRELRNLGLKVMELPMYCTELRDNNLLMRIGSEILKNL